MTRLHLLFVLFILTYTGFSGTAQPVTTHLDSVYQKEMQSFMQQVQGDTLYGHDLWIISASLPWKRADCIESVWKDAQWANKKARTQMRQQVEKTKTVAFDWEQVLQRRLHILPADTVTAIFRDRYRSWLYYHQTYKEGYMQYTLPAFSGDYEYCLFYRAYHCDGKCGEGSLRLYKKVSDRWQMVKEFCYWIS